MNIILLQVFEQRPQRDEVVLLRFNIERHSLATKRGSVEIEPIVFDHRSINGFDRRLCPSESFKPLEVVSVVHHGLLALVFPHFAVCQKIVDGIAEEHGPSMNVLCPKKNLPFDSRFGTFP